MEGEGSASRPGRSLPPGNTRYSLYRKLGGPQGWSRHVRKISPPTGIRSPNRPARSQSLYRLSYRGPPVYMQMGLKKSGVRALTLYAHVIRTSDDFSCLLFVPFLECCRIPVLLRTPPGSSPPAASYFCPAVPSTTSDA